MLKLKNKNGITLIALIITIIVMLILVGVTISMTVGNDGIIAEAKNAKKQMEGAAEADVLQELALGAIGTNGVVDFNKLDEKVSQSELFTGTNGTYTSSKGNTFTVDANGKVTFLGQGTGGGSGTVTESRLGAYVTYKGVTWRVLKDDSSGVELLSENAIGESTLTSDNESWPYSVAYINGRLTANCQQAAGIDNVRSVQITDQPIAESLGLMAAGNSTEYFVDYYDTKSLEDGSEGYYTYSITSTGAINPIYLFTMKDGEVTDFDEFEKTACVRPVASLGAGALDNATGNGSSGQPYVIGD